MFSSVPLLMHIVIKLFVKYNGISNVWECDHMENNIEELVQQEISLSL